MRDQDLIHQGLGKQRRDHRRAGAKDRQREAACDQKSAGFCESNQSQQRTCRIGNRRRRAIGAEDLPILHWTSARRAYRASVGLLLSGADLLELRDDRGGPIDFGGGVSPVCDESLVVKEFQDTESGPIDFSQAGLWGQFPSVPSTRGVVPCVEGLASQDDQALLEAKSVVEVGLEPGFDRFTRPKEGGKGFAAPGTLGDQCMAKGLGDADLDWQGVWTLG